MIKLVKFLRDAFVVILALFSSFVAGMTFGSKLIEKGAEAALSDEKPRPRSRVSYYDYCRKD